ncbi:MAG: hypothetical protein ACE5PV_19510, partial [Candidatus Poribacteria bacterium]
LTMFRIVCRAIRNTQHAIRLSLFILSTFCFVRLIWGVEQAPVGARPMGMGETFVAVADDGNAVHLNPAGISRLQRYILNGMRADLLGASNGLEQNYVSVVLPVTKNFAMGIDWMNIGIDDNELGFTQNKFNLALSLNIRDVMAMGVNGKYVSVYTGLDGMALDTASGFGLDGGMLFFPRFIPQVRDKLQVGLMLQDFAGNHTQGFFGGTSIRHDFVGLPLQEKTENDKIQYRENVLPLHYKFGIAYNIIKNPRRSWLMSVDFDDRLHFGSEFWLHPMAAIRVGTQIDEEGVTYSLGGTLRYINDKLFENSWLELNYAYVLPPTLPATSYFSLSTSFDFQRSPIKIEKVLMRQGISAAHHNSYAETTTPPEEFHQFDGAVDKYQLYDDDTAGRIWLHNKSEKDMDVKVTIAVEEYIPPTDIIDFFTMPAGKTISLPLHLPFRDDIMADAKDENVAARIKILAVEKDSDKRYFTSQDEVFMLHDKNKIVWDDIRRLGSFITVDAVAPFARKILEKHQNLLSKNEERLPENILQAILLFSALIEEHIIYIKDANSPSYGTYLPDTVRYPHQLLSGEIGSADCDDFTALYCAMLESVGINTALIGLKGHILMAFDTGISWQVAQDIALPDIDPSFKYARWYVDPPIDGKAWIPIETTMIGQAKREEISHRGNRFAQAWQNALIQLQMAERNDEKIEYETVADAWEIYKPAYTSPNEDLRKRAVKRISEITFDHDVNHEWLLSISAGIGRVKKEMDR